MPLVASKKLDACEENLLHLLERYSSHPERREELEHAIWSQHGKKCAVMFTDLSGFSSETRELGAVHALAGVYQRQKQMASLLAAYDGHMMKTMGDSIIATFDDPVQALECGTQMVRSNQKLTVGIGFGQVIQLGNRDVFGIEVNHASFLAEDYGLPGQLLVTQPFLAEVQRTCAVSCALVPAHGDWDAFEVYWR